jgi:hypothetical protein
LSQLRRSLAATECRAAAVDALIRPAKPFAGKRLCAYSSLYCDSGASYRAPSFARLPKPNLVEPTLEPQ